MATYQISINERMPLGRNLVALLKSVPQAVSFSEPIAQKKEVNEEDAELYKSLQSAFKDVKLMIDGKKPKKTAQEFLYELRNTNN